MEWGAEHIHTHSHTHTHTHTVAGMEYNLELLRSAGARQRRQARKAGSQGGLTRQADERGEADQAG